MTETQYQFCPESVCEESYREDRALGLVYGPTDPTCCRYCGVKVASDPKPRD